ncbi:MAG: VOC family protein [Minisyncoccia bacterium]
MTTISPWINFNGNAEEAFNFYKSVFGGEFTKVTRFRDLIGTEIPISENETSKIMQITLSIGNGQMLIGNDVPEFMGKTNENENRSKIYVGAESKEEAEKISNELSVGGQVDAPGMFRDKYGIEWIIEFNPNK